MANDIAIEIDPKQLALLQKKFGALASYDTLKRAVTAGGLFLQTWIIKNRLSGPRPGVLGRVTGNLVASIGRSGLYFNQGQNHILKIGTNLEYGRIHEYGGTILPKRKNILAWQDRNSGDWIFAKKVTIPPRPFLKPAVQSRTNIEQVKVIVTKTIMARVKGI